MRFFTPEGAERTDPEVGFADIVRSDTLLSNPLRSEASMLKLLGTLDERFALIATFESALRRRKQTE